METLNLLPYEEGILNYHFSVKVAPVKTASSPNMYLTTQTTLLFIPR